jgi:hypothetical protein
MVDQASLGGNVLVQKEDAVSLVFQSMDTRAQYLPGHRHPYGHSKHSGQH